MCSGTRTDLALGETMDNLAKAHPVRMEFFVTVGPVTQPTLASKPLRLRMTRIYRLIRERPSRRRAEAASAWSGRPAARCHPH